MAAFLIWQELLSGFFLVAAALYGHSVGASWVFTCYFFTQGLVFLIFALSLVEAFNLQPPSEAELMGHAAEGPAELEEVVVERGSRRPKSAAEARLQEARKVLAEARRAKEKAKARARAARARELGRAYETVATDSTVGATLSSDDDDESEEEEDHGLGSTRARRASRPRAPPSLLRVPPPPPPSPSRPPRYAAPVPHSHRTQPCAKSTA